MDKARRIREGRGDRFKTQAGRKLKSLLVLEHVELRDKNESYTHSVWLARLCEQTFLRNLPKHCIKCMLSAVSKLSCYC